MSFSPICCVLSVSFPLSVLHPLCCAVLSYKGAADMYSTFRRTCFHQQATLRHPPPQLQVAPLSIGELKRAPTNFVSIMGLLLSDVAKCVNCTDCIIFQRLVQRMPQVTLVYCTMFFTQVSSGRHLCMCPVSSPLQALFNKKLICFLTCPPLSMCPPVAPRIGFVPSSGLFTLHV
jgi:hypothetical protein